LSWFNRERTRWSHYDLSLFPSRQLLRWRIEELEFERKNPYGWSGIHRRYYHTCAPWSLGRPPYRSTREIFETGSLQWAPNAVILRAFARAAAFVIKHCVYSYIIATGACLAYSLCTYLIVLAANRPPPAHKSEARRPNGHSGRRHAKRRKGKTTATRWWGKGATTTKHVPKAGSSPAAGADDRTGEAASAPASATAACAVSPTAASSDNSTTALLSKAANSRRIGHSVRRHGNVGSRLRLVLVLILVFPPCENAMHQGWHPPAMPAREAQFLVAQTPAAVAAIAAFVPEEDDNNNNNNNSNNNHNHNNNHNNNNNNNNKNNNNNNNNNNHNNNNNNNHNNHNNNNPSVAAQVVAAQVVAAAGEETAEDANGDHHGNNDEAGDDDDDDDSYDSGDGEDDSGDGGDESNEGYSDSDQEEDDVSENDDNRNDAATFLNGDLEGTALSEDLVLAFGTYAGKGGLSLHSVTGNNIRAALSLPGSADVPFVFFDFASMSVRTGAQSVATAETLLLPPTLPRPLSKALAWTRRLALGYTPMVAGGAQSVAAAEMRLLPSTVSVQH